MLGKAFAIICIASFIIAALTGNMAALAPAAIEGAGRAVTLTMALAGTLALWSGVMAVLKRAGAIKFLTRLMMPLFKIAFPDAYRRKLGLEEMSASMAANILGMGNAATPLAMTAMSTLSKDDENTATDDMITFTVMSTAPFNLLPMSIIALRQAAESANPFAVIVPVWITSAAAMFMAICLSRVLRKIRLRRRQR